MRRLPMIADRQCGVFSSAQAASAGWSRSALRWAVQQGRLVTLRPGVWQRAQLDDLAPHTARRWLHAGPAIAAVFSTPGAIASQSSAAVLHDLPLARIPGVACVTVVPWHTGEITRVHVHRATSQPLDGDGIPVERPVAGVSCTTVARTIIDLAREHGISAGVVPADYALRNGLTDEAELRQTLRHCRRWPGVRSARTALDAADPRSESPLESLSRLRLRDFAIPEPELQVRIGDEYGRFVARVDFFWPDFGVVGEADGRLKYTDDQPTALAEEKQRQESLERTGLLVVRWGYDDLRQFEAVAQRLQRAFARSLRSPASDRRWSVLPPSDPR